MSARGLIKQGLAPLARAIAGPPRSLPAACWGLARAPSGALCLQGQSLDGLARTHGTPLHVHDAAALRRNAHALRGLDAFFSYKTQPVPAILASLHAMGMGAEVISEMELDLALRLGVPGSRIIYNGPAKSNRSLRVAMAAGVLLININHRGELLRVAEMARESGLRPRVGIRVTGRKGWSAQFGTPIRGRAALTLFEEALGLPELDVVGLHMHRGALLHTEAELREFTDELLAFADVLHTRLGWSPEIIDAGGSLGLPSVRTFSTRQMRLSRGFGIEIGAPDPAATLSVAEYAARLRAMVTAHFESRARHLPHLVVEPGRAIAGNAQLLLTSVIGLREAGDGGLLAILDAGINIAGIMRTERHQIFLASPPADGAAQRYRLVGPICQPGDVLVDTIWLPPLRIGDVLAIMDSGAYFEPDSTVFSFPRPGTLALDGGETRWLRRPETLADVIARDRFGDAGRVDQLAVQDHGGTHEKGPRQAAALNVSASSADTALRSGDASAAP